VYWHPLYLTDIDQEGVIAADMDPAQQMGDESVEVYCSNIFVTRQHLSADAQR